MVYLSDAFSVFNDDKDSYWIPLQVYFGLNLLSFFSLTQCCIFFSFLWIQIANFIQEESNANRKTKAIIKAMIIINPIFIGVQIILVSLEEYKTISLLYGISSLVFCAVSTHAGRIFRRSLEDYFSGSYISNVNS
jgi:hypothetical protein